MLSSGLSWSASKPQAPPASVVSPEEFFGDFVKSFSTAPDDDLQDKGQRSAKVMSSRGEEEEQSSSDVLQGQVADKMKRLRWTVQDLCLYTMKEAEAVAMEENEWAVIHASDRAPIEDAHRKNISQFLRGKADGEQVRSCLQCFATEDDKITLQNQERSFKLPTRRSRLRAMGADAEGGQTPEEAKPQSKKIRTGKWGQAQPPMKLNRKMGPPVEAAPPSPVSVPMADQDADKPKRRLKTTRLGGRSRKRKASSDASDEAEAEGKAPDESEGVRRSEAAEQEEQVAASSNASMFMSDDALVKMAQEQSRKQKEADDLLAQLQQIKQSREARRRREAAEDAKLFERLLKKSSKAK